MKIEQQLIEKGFKEFLNPLKTHKDVYYKSYQLKVRDDHGNTLYFINVALYDYNLFCNPKVIPDHLKEDLQSDTSVKFTSENGEVFNVEYYEKDVDRMLKFYDNLFHTMNCKSYEQEDFMYYIVSIDYRYYAGKCCSDNETPVWKMVGIRKIMF